MVTLKITTWLCTYCTIPVIILIIMKEKNCFFCTAKRKIENRRKCCKWNYVAFKIAQHKGRKKDVQLFYCILIIILIDLIYFWCASAFNLCYKNAEITCVFVYLYYNKNRIKCRSITETCFWLINLLKKMQFVTKKKNVSY